jgi:hypothetical protein
MTAITDVAAVGQMPSLIEDVLHEYDAVRREHLVVPGTREVVWDAVLEADFLDAWRGNRVVTALFSARGAGERVVSAVRGREYVEPPVPESMRLIDMDGSGEWVVLAEDAPAEIVFGAVGRFWSGETAWETITAAGFERWDAPGYARIACNFSLRSYGSDHTLVTYEVRTRATDEAARRGFLRYWRPLSPFIGVVLRAQLGVVRAEALRRAA